MITTDIIPYLDFCHHNRIIEYLQMLGSQERQLLINIPPCNISSHTIQIGIRNIMPHQHSPVNRRDKLHPPGDRQHGLEIQPDSRERGPIIIGDQIIRVQGIIHFQRHSPCWVITFIKGFQVRQPIITKKTFRFHRNIVIFVREEERLVIVILVTNPQLQFKITEINIRTSQVHSMNPVIHVIRFLSFSINIQIIILEHILQFKTPQESISQRIVQLHIRIHA